MLNEVSSGVLIIVLDGLKERFESDVVTDQRLLIDDDLILLNISTKTEYISYAGHSAQLQLYDPILNRTQFLIALSVANDLVKIDLSRAGSDWSHLRFEPCRDAVFGSGQALEDLLACEINVRVVGEINSDDG